MQDDVEKFDEEKYKNYQEIICEKINKHSNKNYINSIPNEFYQYEKRRQILNL